MAMANYKHQTLLQQTNFQHKIFSLAMKCSGGRLHVWYHISASQYSISASQHHISVSQKYHPQASHSTNVNGPSRTSHPLSTHKPSNNSFAQAMEYFGERPPHLSRRSPGLWRYGQSTRRLHRLGSPFLSLVLHRELSSSLGWSVGAVSEVGWYSLA